MPLDSYEQSWTVRALCTGNIYQYLQKTLMTSFTRKGLRGSLTTVRLDLGLSSLIDLDV